MYHPGIRHNKNTTMELLERTIADVLLKVKEDISKGSKSRDFFVRISLGFDVEI